MRRPACAGETCCGPWLTQQHPFYLELAQAMQQEAARQGPKLDLGRVVQHPDLALATRGAGHELAGEHAAGAVVGGHVRCDLDPAGGNVHGDHGNAGGGSLEHGGLHAPGIDGRQHPPSC